VPWAIDDDHAVVACELVNDWLERTTVAEEARPAQQHRAGAPLLDVELADQGINVAHESFLNVDDSPSLHCV
jgi:hypothetical protein